MKIFISVQANLSLLGIGLHQSMQEYPLNRKNVLTIFILSLWTVLNGLYFHYEAKTFNEYTICVYTMLTGTVAVIVFLITIWKMWHFFTFLLEIQSIVNESESIAIKIECSSLLFIVHFRIKKFKVKRNA